MQNGLSVNTRKPYHHPAIITALKECFFIGSRGSLAENHDARFASSVKQGPGKEEREIPIAMACLIATTVSKIYYQLLICLLIGFIRYMRCWMNGVMEGIQGGQIGDQKHMKMFTVATRCF